MSILSSSDGSSGSVAQLLSAGILPGSPAPPSPPPGYALYVGGENLTNLIDWESLDALRAEHGPGSLTVEMPLSRQFAKISNGLLNGADVRYLVGGEEIWFGDLLDVRRTGPGEAKMQLICAGQWARMRLDKGYCQSFVESDQRLWREVDFSNIDPTGLAWITCPLDYPNIDTEGQLRVMVPLGTDYQAGQGVILALWVNDGLDGGAIKRVTFDAAFSMGNFTAELWVLTDLYPKASIADANAEVVWAPADGTPCDWQPTPGLDPVRCLMLYFGGSAVPGTTAADRYVQFTNLRVYVDRTAAARVDEIIVEIGGDTGLFSADTGNDSIGAALTGFMVRPFSDRADGCALAAKRASGKVLYGNRNSGLIAVKSKATTPPTWARHFVVSAAMQPGMEWDVDLVQEGRPEYVRLIYQSLSVADVPDSTPQVVYYPSTPADRGDNKVEVIDLTGEAPMTTADATSAAEQAYERLRDTVSGSVSGLYEVIKTVDGRKLPVEWIKEWDWIENLDADPDDTARGPHMITEVHISGAGEVQLTIGEQTAYEYLSPDEPSKGRWIGARRVRHKMLFTKWWRRRYGNKPLPKRHPKYHVWWTIKKGRYV